MTKNNFGKENNKFVLYPERNVLFVYWRYPESFRCLKFKLLGPIVKSLKLGDGHGQIDMFPDLK